MIARKLLIAAVFLCSAGFAQNLEANSPFTPPGDPLLQKVASEVAPDEILSEKIQSIVEQMFAVARGERGEGKKLLMVGLAAPQIGISKRIILVDVGIDTKDRTPGSLEVFINPEILWSSPAVAEGKEGCYSVDSRVVGIVSRSTDIRIKALDREGNPVETELSGYTARIFQHELDHLDGIRFPDQVGLQGGDLHWVEETDYSEYKENWERWDRKCSKELWDDMKAGRPFSAPLDNKEDNPE